MLKVIKMSGSKKTKKDEKSDQKLRDPNKPKPPANAFIIYAKKNITKYQERFPGISHKEIVKIIG